MSPVRAQIEAAYRVVSAAFKYLNEEVHRQDPPTRSSAQIRTERRSSAQSGGGGAGARSGAAGRVATRLRRMVAPATERAQRHVVAGGAAHGPFSW